jgi:hypothetical protein
VVYTRFQLAIIIQLHAIIGLNQLFSRAEVLYASFTFLYLWQITIVRTKNIVRESKGGKLTRNAE